jgi:hypothetical protein
MPLLPRRGHGADDAHALVRAGEEATAPGRGAGSSDEGWEHSIFLLQSVWEPQWQVASEKKTYWGGL